MSHSSSGSFSKSYCGPDPGTIDDLMREDGVLRVAAREWAVGKHGGQGISISAGRSSSSDMRGVDSEAITEGSDFGGRSVERKAQLHLIERGTCLEGSCQCRWRSVRGRTECVQASSPYK